MFFNSEPRERQTRRERSKVSKVQGERPSAPCSTLLASVPKEDTVVV